jgi:hypothetical protein
VELDGADDDGFELDGKLEGTELEGVELLGIQVGIELEG